MIAYQNFFFVQENFTFNNEAQMSTIFLVSSMSGQSVQNYVHIESSIDFICKQQVTHVTLFISNACLSGISKRKVFCKEF